MITIWSLLKAKAKMISVPRLMTVERLLINLQYIIST